ncbi:MAG: hypothetical protein A2V69_02535 [Candidatus Portnoybacteria bacterium RBG_13_40_8]|uniref:Uncharacterized protein n=1 Tax=Candidatus Portnoybacteria bacterium RBG_13_40_8 TaxID=1801990 RepID=A0A1G2F447_9BACT|nr:MAG: hypothetical protein A2V69_02535 [Candidatus Portnoybacteria bacterium RBG_13_40_8]
MEKYLAQFRVGGALLTLHGIAVIEDGYGRPVYNQCGTIWKPWENDNPTIKAMVGAILEGDPGPGVEIIIGEGYPGDRKPERTISPFYQNQNKGVKMFSTDRALYVAIKGKVRETWIISWWWAPSGIIHFDEAKNKFRIEEPKTDDKPLVQDMSLNVLPQVTDDGENGDKPGDELDQATKEAIADAQLDHGVAKNGNCRRRE